MRTNCINYLLDPNDPDSSPEFEVFASEIAIGDEIISVTTQRSILPSDDIKTGLLINHKTGSIFPIEEFVLVLLSDEDIDLDFLMAFHKQHLNKFKNKSILIQENINRIKSSRQGTIKGEWNREEMEYYDKEVNTQKKRLEFLHKIKNNPLWHIYLERKKFFVDQVNIDLIKGKHILEIGCGNSRTISWLFHPDKYGYNYVGTDISFKRLILAKNVIPSGELIQCSAFNLPFKNNFFAGGISFGVLHHLPDPLLGFHNTCEKISKAGFIFIHEPIIKPGKLIEENGWIANKLQSYKHSDHDNEISWATFQKYIQEENFSFLSLQFSVSLIRTLFGRFIYRLFPKNNKVIWRILIKSDYLFLRVFCRRPNRFGLGAVIALLEK